MSPFNPWLCQPKNRQFDPKHQLKRFETPTITKERSENLIKILEKGEPQHQDIAKKLQHCDEGGRCLLPICPRCLRQVRRWFVSEAMQCLHGEDLLAVTLVPAEHAIPPGELEHFDLINFKETLSRQLSRAGLGDAIVIGGVDFSFCERSDGEFEPHWRPHFHLIVANTEADQIRSGLKRHYPSAESVSRPIKIQEVEGLMGAISYAMKPFFTRRVSYVDNNEKIRHRKYPLKNDQTREISEFMSRLTITDRMFLKNVRRRGNRLIVADKAVGEKTRGWVR